MPIDIMQGMNENQAKEMAVSMGFEGDQCEQAAQSILGLYKVFVECDCTMVEINPFAELTDGRVMVCDGKVGFDDNAEFRHKELHAKRDTTQEDPREVAAKEFDLNYIGLDGSIACMVNGAGLAMATMDLLKLFGGEPANFLDVGGAANEESITAAFKILQVLFQESFHCLKSSVFVSGFLLPRFGIRRIVAHFSSTKKSQLCFRYSHMKLTQTSSNRATRMSNQFSSTSSVVSCDAM